MAELFAGKEWQTFLQILPTIPFETWETVWSTVVATLLALVIGLPLGVCLVTGEQGGVRPLPRWLMALLNGLVNLLRSVPFLILMIIVIPLSRAIVGTSIGTVASIVPLVIASFPFVSRLVETSMREVDAGVIEADQSQRMLNALLPGTVVPIHSHPHSAETAVVLSGCLDEIYFDDKGRETARFTLRAGEGLQIPLGQFHTVEVKEPTILFESKDGAYAPAAPEDIIDKQP